MALPPLPVEVIHRILLFLPLMVLKDIRLQTTDVSLWNLIDPVLYEKVYFGIECPEGYCNVSLDDLAQLDTKASEGTIKWFRLYTFDMMGVQFDHLAFQRFCKTHPNFFKKIPHIELYGNTQDLRQYMKWIPSTSIMNLSVRHQLTFPVPPNLTRLEIFGFPPDAETLRDLPVTMKELYLENCQSLPDVRLPDWIELLVCTRRTPYPLNKFPQGLRTLDLSGNPDIDINSLVLPTGLTSLDLSQCRIMEINTLMSKLPAGLKVLKLEYNNISSLAGVEFPSEIEVLDLLYCTLDTVEDAVFPQLLQELYLKRNCLMKLDTLNLPELRVLDISNFTTIFMHWIGNLSHIALPPKLETLNAEGQPIKDWDLTALPPSLKKLVMLVPPSTNIKMLLFPPNLESLEILFFNTQEAKYSDLKLPQCLQKLSLNYGVSSDFEWNLPNLLTMSVENFEGPLRVPETVENLKLACQNASTKLKIPASVIKLDVMYPLNRYPNNVIDLSVGRFDNSAPVVFPPRLQRLRLLTSAPMNGEILELPDTLEYLSGKFRSLPKKTKRLTVFA